VTALSKRLVRDELARGTLKPVKATGWPLQRTIRIVRLREAFVSKAVQHFLQLVRKRLRDVRFLETVEAVETSSRLE
jgi:DNA-binding transcriptional LysR family regulator